MRAVSSSLNHAARNLRPRHQDIDWLRTIRANLRHYQPEYRTIIPQTRVCFGRRGRSLRDIVLCVDQSGSMASPVVYAGVFAAVLASIKAVSTSVVVFDTAVADLTPLLSDPVEVLFGTQLVGSGVQVIALLALNDSGAPSYDRDNAARLSAMGIPCFACTPDLFPDLMAATIQRHSLE